MRRAISSLFGDSMAIKMNRMPLLLLVVVLLMRALLTCVRLVVVVLLLLMVRVWRLN